jgi:hypothetical protein
MQNRLNKYVNISDEIHSFNANVLSEMSESVLNKE